MENVKWWKNWRIKSNGIFRNHKCSNCFNWGNTPLKLLPIYLIALLFISGCFGDKKITANCLWASYGGENESFLINTSKGEIIWVEEEKTIKISENNDAYIKFSGVKSVLQVSGSKTLKEVPLSFKINKLNGHLNVIANADLTYKAIDMVNALRGGGDKYIDVTPVIQHDVAGYNFCNFDKDW